MKPKLGILVFTAAVISLCTADDVSDNTVSIKLYPMQVADWTTADNASLATAIVNAANSYCPTALTACNLNADVNFTSDLVGISSLSDSSKSMEMGVYLYYPGGASVITASTVLLQTALKTVLQNARDSIKGSIDTYVTYIGNDYYGIPPDDTANQVIIPLALVVVISAALLTLGLSKWQASKERAETLRLRQERRQARQAAKSANSDHSGMDTTQTTFYSSTTTPRHTHPANNSASNSTNRVAPGQHNPEAAAPTTIMHYGNFSVNDFIPEEGDRLGKSGLAPLQNSPNEKGADRLSEDEEARKERKRRKKERRREKERLRQQQQNESLEMYDNQAMDTSNLTTTESEIPTFKVEA